MILPNWLTQRSQQKKNHPALVFAGQIWTYAELEQAAVNLANHLTTWEIKQGDRVAVLLTNSPNYVFLIHALTKLGAIAVLLNTRLTAKEIAWQLHDSQTLYLIYGAEYAEIVSAVEQELDRQIQLINIDHDIANHPSSTQAPLLEDIELEAVQAIIYTSGTTGKPKGALLTYGNHFHSATASAWNLGLDPQRDRWLLCLPLFHVGGLSIIWRSAIYGTTVVLLPRFDIAAINTAIMDQSITTISLVPTMLSRILASEEFPAALSAWQNLRCVLLGGAAPHHQLWSECQRLQLPIAPTYGLTETASQSTVLLPVHTYQKPLSSGQALSCLRLRIVDPNSRDRELPTGEIGEIAIQGANVMRGYLNMETPAFDAKGWFYTGDLGYLDSENYLYVVSRRTDLIVTGGENVYPAEIESVLLTHPVISEACVIGLPDPDWGQVVTAVVVAKSNLDLKALQQFCQEQHLASYKIPKSLHIVPELAKTASGKISRTAIQAQICTPQLISSTI